MTVTVTNNDEWSNLGWCLTLRRKKWQLTIIYGTTAHIIYILYDSDMMLYSKRVPVQFILISSKEEMQLYSGT